MKNNLSEVVIIMKGEQLTLQTRLIMKYINVLTIAFLASFQSLAQTVDYSAQVDAFKESLSQKSVEPLKEYISPELKFGPMQPEMSEAVLTNIVTQFPKFNSIEIVKAESGKAIVAYDFEQLGKSESTILFDEDGKIKTIELIDNLIAEQIKQQQAMAKSVQVPNPGELVTKFPSKEVSFKSLDGLLIAGSLYEIDAKSPVILLCHQAGYNKYEYADIAPRLNEMGYNCLAIDQRSGGTFADRKNETFEKATAKGLSTDYVDAEQDMIAALNYLSKKYKQDVILWGSSYSSALALHIGNNKKVKAVISFSPGDYFGEQKENLVEVLPALKKPFFVTSSKEESLRLKESMEEVKESDSQVQFIPESEGFHGSRALWVGQEGSNEYWTALKAFLSTVN